MKDKKNQSVSIGDYPFIKENKKVLSYLFCKKNNLIVLDENTSKVFVALSDIYNIDAINEMRLI
ncbi:MAG: hypothetical protein JXA94_02650, partial [Parachlamydiales bacterium]|nr:hypothetical protein [Parachlamydiales bacterium]